MKKGRVSKSASYKTPEKSGKEAEAEDSPKSDSPSTLTRKNRLILLHHRLKTNTMCVLHANAPAFQLLAGSRGMTGSNVMRMRDGITTFVANANEIN